MLIYRITSLSRCFLRLTRRIVNAETIAEMAIKLMKINEIKLEVDLLAGLTEVFVNTTGAVGPLDAIGRILPCSAESFTVENATMVLSE